MNIRRFAVSLSLFTPVIVALAGSAAFAAGTQTSNIGALPWDGTLQALAGVLSGNVAKYISVIAIFVAGLALIFGEELGQFARRMLMIVIAIAFLVGAGSFATAFIGQASGAVL